MLPCNYILIGANDPVTKALAQKDYSKNWGVDIAIDHISCLDHLPQSIDGRQYKAIIVNLASMSNLGQLLVKQVREKSSLPVIAVGYFEHETLVAEALKLYEYYIPIFNFREEIVLMSRHLVINNVEPWQQQG